MANVDTVKYITTNLEGILIGLGYALEDLSGDPDVDVTPVCQLFYKGEDFGDKSGEHNKFNEIDFLIKIELSDKSPDSSRAKQKQRVRDLKKGITVPWLNVGALASSKLVSRVIHTMGSDLIDYNPPMSTINYPLTVRYREI